MPYEAVIGLEVHVQLLTRTKLFCGCEIKFGSPPNTQVCPICLGHPGSLPVLNRGAFELAMRAALACKTLPTTTTANATAADAQEANACDEHLRGEGIIVRRVAGYKKIRYYTHENIGYGPVALPDQELHTTAT